MAEDVTLLSAKDLIALHEQWKRTLWAASFTRTPLTEEQIDQIVHERHCAVGRWLASPACEELREHSKFKTIVLNHQEFHAEMMKVAALLSARDFRGAAQAICEGSRFVRSGRRLALSMLALNQIARMRVAA